MSYYVHTPAEPVMVKPPAPCGTDAGWRRHRREGTDPCQPCRDAHSAYMRAYRRRTGLTTSTLVALDTQCPNCGHHIMEEVQE